MTRYLRDKGNVYAIDPINFEKMMKQMAERKPVEVANYGVLVAQKINAAQVIKLSDISPEVAKILMTSCHLCGNPLRSWVDHRDDCPEG